MTRVLLAAFLAFAPSFLIADMAHASCVYPGQEAAVAAAQQASSSEPVVVEINTCGGDDTSYQVPLSVEVTFDGQTFDRVFATTNSVITFGNPDGTYWDYPQTPSISLYSFDWVVYPGARSDEHLIIRSSDGGFQVDISARPIWLQNATEPTNIVITAAILSDGTVAMAYTLSGPEYPEANPRTGVRLNDGTIETFEEYGIQETEETPELAPEPTEEAPFTPEPEPTPTESPTTSPEPTPEPLVLNEPTNLTATQLENGSIQLTWDPPTQSNTIVERYAVSWSVDNFQTGWGVASMTNSITLDRDLFATTGGLDQTYQFRIRSDNDTESVYSSFSGTASALVTSPPPPAPNIPEGAEVVSEGSVFSVVAPEGQRIANVVGYYGDPNDSTRGGEVSSILFELLAGSTSATVEVTNETFQNDPAPGTVKILIILISFEDVPAQPTPEPSPSETTEPAPIETTPPQPESTPSPTPNPEPSIPEPAPQPPVESPGIIEPTPEPVEEPVIEPSPEPTTIPSEEEPAPEPEISKEPVEEPTENEPEPLPEAEPTETTEPREPELPVEEVTPEPLEIEDIGPDTEITEEAIDILLSENFEPELLTEAQIEQIIEITNEIFESAEKGSEEYEQALDLLMVAAQADDLQLPEELAAIPLIGNIAGAALEVFNNLGNIGADMSPQVREDAEKTVIASVIAVQAAVSAIATVSTTTVSSGTRRI